MPNIDNECSALTANEHDTNRKNLLRVGVGRDVSKSHAGQTTEGEVQCSYIFILDGGAGEGIAVIVTFANLVSQVVQPADLHASNTGRAGALHVANGVPDACQPVSDEGKGAHEEEEHCRAVLRVTVQFPRYSHQSQQPRSLQKTNQSRGLRLEGRVWED